MAREFSRKFYQSKLWEKTRNAYIASLPAPLCEKCLREGRYVPGEIVHHKVHLEPHNINDQSIATSFENLELVCRQCHAEEHPEVYESKRTNPSRLRVRFDKYGNVVELEDTGDQD